jgi:hypothetical protein
MSKDFVEVQIGSEGLAYIRECLSTGKRLSPAVLANVDLEKGTLTMFVPPDTPVNELDQFWEGGITGQDMFYRETSSGVERFAHVHSSDAEAVSLIVEQLY